jgi:hypothetical protein
MPFIASFGVRRILSHQISCETGEGSEESQFNRLEPGGNNREVAACMVEGYAVRDVVCSSDCVAGKWLFVLVVRYWLDGATDS